MSMTRKEFLASSLRGVGSVVTLVLVGCPNDDDDDDGDDVDATGTTGEPTTGTETTAAETTVTTGTTMDEDTTGDGTETTGTDDTAADETAGVPACGEVVAEVSQPPVGPEHDHVVVIPSEDVLAGRETTYMTSMDLGHVHWVTVTASMFGLLLDGQEVAVEIDADSTQHTHTITIVCA
jgi:hypothetical protein